ncbi:MAG: ABC transporter ATP-binding protein, partial [Ottowia sp.]|nr:ABC transporter ATP-binding protein [Ottowia sp.]
MQVRDLELAFLNADAPAKVLHGVSLNVKAREKVALVGESGSGKSVIARIVTGLLRPGRDAEISGSVRIEGREVLALDESTFRKMRGTFMSMIFQDPTSALNPLFTVGDQFHEVL